jgi:ribosomal protein S21
MAIARVRVELKPTKRGQAVDFKIMFQEFKRRVSDVGILHELKDRQYFESKRRKDRLAKRQAVQRRKEDEVEGMILRGEKVEGSSKIVRKIRTRIKARKAKEKQRELREQQRGKFSER